MWTLYRIMVEGDANWTEITLRNRLRLKNFDLRISLSQLLNNNRDHAAEFKGEQGILSNY